eukprot:TRINITY_DN2441_c0_g1_i1.p1 TRINITY_DN2441_c0_g1~~TRINITY_DN2441_c0_g1_i1.p1  ORF type:complete len:668 (+),score=76.66 TRINITY_DN2441_c0_g1_i1:444-2447(+)
MIEAKKQAQLIEAEKQAQIIEAKKQAQLIEVQKQARIIEAMKKAQKIEAQKLAQILEAQKSSQKIEASSVVHSSPNIIQGQYLESKRKGNAFPSENSSGERILYQSPFPDNATEESGPSVHKLKPPPILIPSDPKTQSASTQINKKSTYDKKPPRSPNLDEPKPSQDINPFEAQERLIDASKKSQFQKRATKPAHDSDVKTFQNKSASFSRNYAQRMISSQNSEPEILEEKKAIINTSYENHPKYIMRAPATTKDRLSTSAIISSKFGMDRMQYSLRHGNESFEDKKCLKNVSRKSSYQKRLIPYATPQLSGKQPIKYRHSQFKGPNSSSPEKKKVQTRAQRQFLQQIANELGKCVCCSRTLLMSCCKMCSQCNGPICSYCEPECIHKKELICTECYSESEEEFEQEQEEEEFECCKCGILPYDPQSMIKCSNCDRLFCEECESFILPCQLCGQVLCDICVKCCNSCDACICEGKCRKFCVGCESIYCSRCAVRCPKCQWKLVAEGENEEFVQLSLNDLDAEAIDKDSEDLFVVRGSIEFKYGIHSFEVTIEEVQRDCAGFGIGICTEEAYIEYHSLPIDQRDGADILLGITANNSAMSPLLKGPRSKLKPGQTYKFTVDREKQQFVIIGPGTNLNAPLNPDSIYLPLLTRCHGLFKVRVRPLFAFL